MLESYFYSIDWSLAMIDLVLVSSYLNFEVTKHKS